MAILPSYSHFEKSRVNRSMAIPSRKDAESQVESWGFKHVFTWSDSRSASSTPHLLECADRHSNAYYPPHKHTGLTTHLILRGSLTISYPDDKNPIKETFGPGSRLDVDARRRHEVWMSSEGCTYVIGE